MTQQRGSSPGIASRVWVVMPMVGRSFMLKASRRRASLQPFRGLGDEPVHHRFVAAGLAEGGELAVGAGALVQDTEGVLDFLAATELVHHVVDEPLDQLADQGARRELDFLAEVDELAVEPVATRAPLVLLDATGRVHTVR